LTRGTGGDFDSIEGILSSDFVNHNPTPMPGIGRDRAGILAAMRYIRQGFPDAQAEVLNVVAEGDKVVIHDRVTGTHEAEFFGVPATGRRATWEFIYIFRIAGGRIAERWGILDVMGLMQQLGAVPMPQTADVS
jgi:predicted ester cyclase